VFVSLSVCLSACLSDRISPEPHARSLSIFGRPFVKRFALCCRSVVCLSVCPSVTYVHCRQTVGWIKMKLGKQVGLGPGHIVLDGDPAPPTPKGHSPQFPAHICCGQMAAWIKMPLGMEIGLGPGDFVRWVPRSLPKKGADPPQIFGTYLLWLNGWMDQDGTWQGGGPWSRAQKIVLDGTQLPSPKRAEPPIFGPFLLWPNGLDQDATWYGGRPQPRRLCGHTAAWIKMPPGTEVGLGLRDTVLDGDPAPLPKGAQSPPPIFSQCLLWTNGWMD